MLITIGGGGPVATSLQGHKYAMLLMDDYTSFTWVYFLAHKSQAEDMLRTFVMQQAASGKLISKIRTDNGGEFISSAIADFLAERGIIHARSPPYTPQYQGRVERMNSLNADNEGTDYIRLPGCVVRKGESPVRLLKKALYGLRRAPKAWNSTFTEWVVSVGFKATDSELVSACH